MYDPPAYLWALIVAGTSASGSSLIGAAEGVTLSSWYPVRAPPAPADVTITATTQSLAALIFTGSDAGIECRSGLRLRLTAEALPRSIIGMRAAAG